MKIQQMFSPSKDRIFLLLLFLWMLLLTFILRLQDDIPKWCYMFERKGKPPNKYVYVYVYKYVIPGFFFPLPNLVPVASLGLGAQCHGSIAETSRWLSD